MMLCQRTHIGLIQRACPRLSSHRDSSGCSPCSQIMPHKDPHNLLCVGLVWRTRRGRSALWGMQPVLWHPGRASRGHRGFSQAVVTLWDSSFGAHSAGTAALQHPSAGWYGSGRRIILWEAVIKRCMRTDWIADLDEYVRGLGSLALSLHYKKDSPFLGLCCYPPNT